MITIKTWKKRWFCLKEETKLYYYLPNREQCKGSIDLTQVSEIIECPVEKKKV